MDHEGELYRPILDFLVTEKGSYDKETSGYTSAFGIEEGTGKYLAIHHYGFNIEPDVFLLGQNGEIILCEGKIEIDKRNLETALGQAIVYQRYSHFTYLFFPYDEVMKLKNGLELISSYIDPHGIGLLLVDNNGGVTEEIIPSLSPYLREKNVNLLLEIYNNLYEVRNQLLDLDPYVFEDPNDLTASRAFVIRDFCIFLNQFPDQNETFDELTLSFQNWIEQTLDKKNEIEQYWKAQMGRATPYNRSKGGVFGSLHLKLIRENDDGILELTALGEALVDICEEPCEKWLSEIERLFFFSLAYSRKIPRRFIEILKRASNKMMLHQNSCGHQDGIRKKNGKMYCNNNDCLIELELDDLSLSERYKLNWTDDFSYWQQVFWMQSAVFSSGSLKFKYEGFDEFHSE